MTTDTETLSKSPQIKRNHFRRCLSLPRNMPGFSNLPASGRRGADVHGTRQPPTKATGDESCHSSAGFWVVADGKSNSPEMPFSYRLTLGYDREEEVYRHLGRFHVHLPMEV